MNIVCSIEIHKVVQHNYFSTEYQFPILGVRRHGYKFYAGSSDWLYSVEKSYSDYYLYHEKLLFVLFSVRQMKLLFGSAAKYINERTHLLWH